MPKRLSLYTEHFGFEKAWIVKVLKLLPSSPDLFKSQNAPMTLGIGPNKIRGLQIWMRGMELIEGSTESTRLSLLGRIISDHDEYLNEYGTWLALVHNLSVCPPHNPAGFYWFFNEFNKMQFKREELKAALMESGLFAHLKDSSREEGLRSLLAALRNPIISDELMLFQEVEKGIFRKGYPPKEFFHPLILAYSIADWAARNGKKDVVAIEEIVHGKGLPGRVFNLSERYVHDKLDEIDIKYAKGILDVERFAALDRVTLRKKEPTLLLELFYKETL